MLFLGAVHQTHPMTVSGTSEPETLEGLALASDLLTQKARLASDYSNAVRSSIQEEAIGQYGHIVLEIKATMEHLLKKAACHM